MIKDGQKTEGLTLRLVPAALMSLLMAAEPSENMWGLLTYS